MKILSVLILFMMVFSSTCYTQDIKTWTFKTDRKNRTMDVIRISENGDTVIKKYIYMSSDYLKIFGILASTYITGGACYATQEDQIIVTTLLNSTKEVTRNKKRSKNR